jgi:DNA helicase II / ATP-dependent DNA helicase PcrA
MEYSIYQNDIFDEVLNGNSNVVISAVAGSGKTTTIKECLNLIPKDSDSIYMAFNNNIVEEMKDKLKGTKTQITTMHSFGWRAIMKATNYKAKLNKSKSYKHIEIILRKNKITDEKKKSYYFYMLSIMLDLMRQNLIDDEDNIVELGLKYDFLLGEDDVKMLDDILTRMNKDKKEYDFTDMIYRTVLDNIRLPKYDYIFVDESQDLSKCQQAIISKIRKIDGRMVAVGDPSQAIYGFAGSDNNSYSNLKDMFANTIELPLSVNYRCATRIVEEAQKINSQILPFNGNKKGIVKDGFVKEITDSDWVLCRNVKPLVQLNLYLLDRQIKSFIKGYDIGIGLMRLVSKSSNARIEKCLKSYEGEIFKQMVKLKKRGVRNPKNTEKIDGMNQKLEILKILSKDLIFSKDLISRIKSIFKDSGDGVVLSTIHKAKGTENSRIFFLLPNLIPSQYATQSWQLEQEQNLMYVAITRAKHELIYINEDAFKPVKDKIKELIK